MSSPWTAHDRGSTRAPQLRGMSDGSWKAFADGTATNSAEAPFAEPTPIAFQFSHRLNLPIRHCRHLPQNNDGSTATKSPTFTFCTSFATATTAPQNSWPGTIG